MQVCARVPGNADVIEVIRGDVTSLKAVANRFRRKPSKILDPTEAFLFGRGDELSILDEACRRAAVVGVDAKNVHVARRAAGMVVDCAASAHPPPDRSVSRPAAPSLGRPRSCRPG